MFRRGTKFALGLTLALGAQLAADGASAQQATLDRIKRSGTINVCADPDLLPFEPSDSWIAVVSTLPILSLPAQIIGSK